VSPDSCGPRILHDYLDVDYDIVWEVVTMHLPALIAMLRMRVIPEAGR
jgi:uncharacterized protein with HEPN domain